jgi:transposase
MKFLSARQARAMIATVEPRDLAGQTRRRLAVGLTGELEAIDNKTRALDEELTGLVTARGSTLMDLHGIGPSGAARLLADAGDIRRFASRDRFASWNGTAPLDASSGSQARHRLSRAGNRRINRVLHIMTVVQLPDQTKGPRLLRRTASWRNAVHDGHAGAETEAVQRRLRPHARRPETTRSEPGRAIGTTAHSSVAGPGPGTGPSDKPRPGPGHSTA